MKYLFFIIFILLYLAANYYVFYRAWHAIPLTNIITKTIFIVFAIVVVFSFFIFSLLDDSLPVSVSSILYKVGTSWFVFLLYLLLFTLLGDLLRVSRLVPANMMNLYSKENWMIFSLVITFLLLLMSAGYLKYKNKVRIDLPITVDKTMPNDSTLRIVAVSDIHLGYGIGKDELNDWIELINKENPDIVLIGGDIIDNSVRPLRYANMENDFRKIKSKYGVYTILGNHEYISGVDKSVQFIKDAGIHLLRDETVLIDSAFYLVGRDDRSNPDRKALSDLMTSVDKSKPVILLDHQPYNLEQAENNGVDLQFSGHTHRGQIWPISLITDYMYEKSYGFLKKGDANIYVSSGIGIWGGKFRIGTQSEYVVIDLKTK